MNIRWLSNVAVVGLIVLGGDARAWETFGYSSSDGWIVQELGIPRVPATVYYGDGSQLAPMSKEHLFMNVRASDLVVSARIESVKFFYFAAKNGDARVTSSEAHVRATVMRTYLGPETESSIEMTLLYPSIPGCIRYADQDGPEQIVVGDTYIFMCSYSEKLNTWVANAGRLLRIQDGVVSRCRRDATFGDFDPSAYLDFLSGTAVIDQQVAAAQLAVLGRVSDDAGQTTSTQVVVDRILRGSCGSKIWVMEKDLGDYAGRLAMPPGTRVLLLLEACNGGYRPVAGWLSVYPLDYVRALPSIQGGLKSAVDIVSEKVVRE